MTQAKSHSALMKKDRQILISLLITLGFVFTVLVSWLIRKQLSQPDLSHGGMLVKTLTKTGWIVILLTIATKSLYTTLHASLGSRIKKTLTCIGFMLPLVVLLFINSAHVDTVQSMNGPTLAYFLAYAVSVGIAEELTFRGVIFNVLIKRHTFLYSIIISSLLFGGVHVVNVFNDNHDFTAVISQIALTFGLGMYFSGIRLFTGSLVPSIILHTLFNIAFGGELAQLAGIEQPEKVVEEGVTKWTSIAYNLVALLGLCYYGYRAALLADRKSANAENDTATC